MKMVKNQRKNMQERYDKSIRPQKKEEKAKRPQAGLVDVNFFYLGTMNKKASNDLIILKTISNNIQANKKIDKVEESWCKAEKISTFATNDEHPM